MEKLVCVSVTFLLLFSWCLGTEIDLTVEISPGRQECFWQHFPASTNVDVDYQVIDGGDMDIDLLIAGPDNRVYHMDRRKTENVVGFKTTNEGDYKVCFDNTFSRISSKVVYFEIFAEDGKDDDDDNNGHDKLTFEGENIQGMLDMTVQDFLGILERAKKNLDSSIQVQTLIRVHEAKDRNVQEANFFLVNFFSCLQLALMISVGLVQVFMIRSLFFDKQPVSGASLKART